LTTIFLRHLSFVSGFQQVGFLQDVWLFRFDASVVHPDLLHLCIQLFQVTADHKQLFVLLHDQVRHGHFIPIFLVRSCLDLVLYGLQLLQSSLKVFQGLPKKRRGKFLDPIHVHHLPFQSRLNIPVNLRSTIVLFLFRHGKGDLSMRGLCFDRPLGVQNGRRHAITNRFAQGDDLLVQLQHLRHQEGFRFLSELI